VAPSDKTNTLKDRAMMSLSPPVSGLSLAVFRIALGGILIRDCWRFIKYDRLYRYWIQPDGSSRSSTSHIPVSAGD
jgi:hypothetical protein